MRQVGDRITPKQAGVGKKKPNRAPFRSSSPMGPPTPPLLRANVLNKEQRRNAKGKTVVKAPSKAVERVLKTGVAKSKKEADEANRYLHNVGRLLPAKDEARRKAQLGPEPEKSSFFGEIGKTIGNVLDAAPLPSFDFTLPGGRHGEGRRTKIDPTVADLITFIPVGGLAVGGGIKVTRSVATRLAARAAAKSATPAERALLKATERALRGGGRISRTGKRVKTRAQYEATFKAPTRLIQAGGGGALGVGGTAAATTATRPKETAGFERAALRVAEAPGHIALAAADDPFGFSSATAKGTQQMLVGLPAGIVAMFKDPAAAIEAIKADYSHRYGPLVAGDRKAFREIAKQEGLTPYALDALSFAAPPSRILGSLARSGALGNRARIASTTARPALRVAEDIVKERPASKGVIGLVGQRVYERASRRRTATRQGKVGKLRAVEPNINEIVPVTRWRANTLDARATAKEAARSQHLSTAEEIALRKSLRKGLKGLSDVQRSSLKVGVQLGIRTPEVARVELPKRIASIERQRAKDGRPVHAQDDELPGLRRAVEQADEVFTPKFGAAADLIRDLGRQTARLDPAFGDPAARARRFAVQREHLADAAEATAEPAPSGLSATAAQFKDAPGEAVQAYGAHHVIDAKPGKPGIADESNAANMKIIFRDKDGSPAGEFIAPREGSEVMVPSIFVKPEARGQGVARVMAEYAHDKGYRLMQGDDLALGSVSPEGRGLAAALAKPGPDGHASEHEVWINGKQQYKPLPEDAGIAATTATARQRGLASPGYWPSQTESSLLRGSNPVGSSLTGAAPGSKQYLGHLTRRGVESTDPALLADALTGNIRRGYQWNLVTQIIARHAPKWGRDKTLSQLNDDLARRGLNPDDWAAVNPRKLHELDGLDLPDDEMRNAFRRALDPEEFANVPQLSLIPKHLVGELEGRVGGLGRAAGFAKSKVSRAILGALNVPWIQFQLVSNTAMMGLAGATPAALVRQFKWWRSLTPAQRAALDPFVGQGHFSSELGTARLVKGEGGRLTQAFRAYKKSTLGRVGAAANPLTRTLHVNHVQDLAFRRAVLHSKINREAYRRMNKTHGRLHTAQQRVIDGLLLRSPKSAKELLDNKPLLEKAANELDTYLGDYLTYTKTERSFFSNNVMWYGYLRFSTRLLFYTMPMKHPTTLAILGKLAQFGSDENMKLFEGNEEGVLPFNLGRVFTKGGEMAVDLSRGNPILNSFTQATGIAGLAAGMLPPYITQFIEQATREKLFTSKDWRIKGTAEPLVPEAGVDAGTRARIVARDTLSLFYPYRVVEDILAGGQPLGADHLAFSPRPTEYAEGGEITQSIESRKSDEEERSLGSRLLEQIVPALPKPTHDQEMVQSRADRIRTARGEDKEGDQPGWGAGGGSKDKDSPGWGKKPGGKSSSGWGSAGR